ncbi:Sodium-coupled monocarboxylate transporter 1, partial [Armadillidium nasatum]
MEESKVIFSVLDYIIFFSLILISFLIGIFSSFKGNKSPEEFLMGNRSLKPLPVAMSLLSSFISVVNLVGSTTEVYLHGTQLFMATIGCLIGILNSLFIVIPVIYPLKLTSIHEHCILLLFSYSHESR